MHVEARGQHELSFLRCCPPFGLEHSQVGWNRWPGNIRNLAVSTSPVLVLEVHVTMPSFLKYRIQVLMLVRQVLP